MEQLDESTSTSDFVMDLFDDGTIPVNAGGDRAVPNIAFFHESVYAE